MSSKKYDLVVYIGRFQPFHKGHYETISAAASYSNNLLVLIGSASAPRTIKNPWTYEERKAAISDSVSFASELSLSFAGLNDYTYNNNKWIEQVGQKISKTVQNLRTDGKKIIRVAVIGHDKDHSSFYLNFFPQWDYIEMEPYPNATDVIDSTQIRQLMFENSLSFTHSVIPNNGDYVKKFVETPEFAGLQAEWDYVKEYNKRWSVAPYAPTFVTVDAIVEQSGHVLLIQRGGFPGKGLWAMPGGFIDQNEWLEAGVIRELREETGLKVPEKVLKGSIEVRDVFDSPNRSTRGRTITHAYLFKLDDAATLPRVRGADDAAKAQWFSLAELKEMQGVMYEDHFSIIMNMLNKSTRG